jgi:hypothetical protein
MNKKKRIMQIRESRIGYRISKATLQNSDIELCIRVQRVMHRNFMSLRSMDAVFKKPD